MFISPRTLLWAGIVLSLLLGCFFFIRTQALVDLPLEEIASYLSAGFGGPWTLEVGGSSSAQKGRWNLAQVTVTSPWFTLQAQRISLPGDYLTMLLAEKVSLPPVLLEGGTITTQWGNLEFSTLEGRPGPQGGYLLEGDLLSPQGERTHLAGLWGGEENLLDLELTGGPAELPERIVIKEGEAGYILLAQGQIGTAEGQLQGQGEGLLIEDLVYHGSYGQLQGRGTLEPQGLALDFTFHPTTSWPGELSYFGTLTYRGQLAIEGWISGDLHPGGMALWEGFQAQLDYQAGRWILTEGEAWGQGLVYAFQGETDPHGVLFEASFQGEPSFSPFGPLMGQLVLQDEEIILEAQWRDGFRLQGQLRLADGALQINEAQLEGQDSRLTLGGSIGEQGNIDLAGHLDGDLSFLRYFLPQLPLQGGRLQGPITVGGTLDQGILEASLQLGDGRLSYPSLPLTIEELTGQLLLADGQIFLSHLRGKVNDGQLQGGGTIGGDGSLDLRMALQGGFYSRDWPGLAIEAVVDGDLLLKGTVAEPRIEGRLWSQQGVVRYLGTPFDLKGAQLDFPRGQEPQLSLWSRSPGPDGPLNLYLGGPLSRPQAQLTRGLQEGRADLLHWPQLLTDGGGLNELARREIWAAIDGYLWRTSARHFQRLTGAGGFRLFLRSQLAQGQVWFEGAKSLGKDLFISYRHPLLGGEEGRWQLDLGQGTWALYLGRGKGYRLGLESRLTF
jgi:hypothetical protein